MAIFAGTLLAACGGSGPTGPQPLKYHLDDMYLAQVPIAQKNGVVKAQNDYSVAKMRNANAKYDLDELDLEIERAKNERQQAILEEETAAAEKRRADESADMNRVNNAMAKARAAELARKAADIRVEYLGAKKKALKLFVTYTLEDLYATEARFELAKASVAKSNNIRPKGFEHQRFVTQANKRKDRVRSAEAKFKDAKRVALDKRKQWQALLQEAQRANGGTPVENTDTSSESTSSWTQPAPAPSTTVTSAQSDSAPAPAAETTEPTTKDPFTGDESAAAPATP
ncbi:MAG TPA: hypothetical protein VFG83_01855 [Kofleriaceae bacterium]|nr:hypothetical protein [Kofleriaceae bacterium]